MSGIDGILTAVNLWIGQHQFLVVSVVVPILSAFIAWRGVIGANRSLRASLEFQRHQASLERKLGAYKEARDALADFSGLLVETAQSIRRESNARKDERARTTEKIKSLHRQFYQAMFRYSQLTSATSALTEAFEADIDELARFVDQLAEGDNAEETSAKMKSMKFPIVALDALRKAGAEIEGLHL